MKCSSGMHVKGLRSSILASVTEGDEGGAEGGIEGRRDKVRGIFFKCLFRFEILIQLYA